MFRKQAFFARSLGPVTNFPGYTITSPGIGGPDFKTPLYFEGATHLDDTLVVQKGAVNPGLPSYETAPVAPMDPPTLIKANDLVDEKSLKPEPNVRAGDIIQSGSGQAARGFSSNEKIKTKVLTLADFDNTQNYSIAKKMCPRTLLPLPPRKGSLRKAQNHAKSTSTLISKSNKFDLLFSYARQNKTACFLKKMFLLLDLRSIFLCFLWLFPLPFKWPSRKDCQKSRPLVHHGAFGNAFFIGAAIRFRCRGQAPEARACWRAARAAGWCRSRLRCCSTR